MSYRTYVNDTQIFGLINRYRTNWKNSLLHQTFQIPLVADCLIDAEHHDLISTWTEII